MMGGLLTYMVADTNFLSLMYQHLEDHQRHDRFAGSFQDALPFLLNAYHCALSKLKPLFPESIRDELTEIIAELSHPDPDKRGNPPRLLNKHNRYSLERYISVTDRLAKKVK